MPQDRATPSCWRRARPSRATSRCRAGRNARVHHDPDGGGQPAPACDRRIEPALHAPLLAKIQSTNSLPAIHTAPGAHHWRLELLEFGPTGGGDEIIRLGSGGSDQSTLAVVPHNLVIDRCYIHGDPVTGQKRGIGLNSASTTIVNSHISEIKATTIDTQAICGWNGPGPFVIENNYLEAAGENVMFGGADPKIPNLVPSDITIRLNHLSKPRSWQQSGQWLVKNLLELKNARRVLIEGNVFEHSWKRWAERHRDRPDAAQPGRHGAMVGRVGCHGPLQHRAARRRGHQPYRLRRQPYEPAGEQYPHRAQSLLRRERGGWARAVPADRERPRVRDRRAQHRLPDRRAGAVYGQRSDGTYDVVTGFRFANNLALHNASGIFGDGGGGFGLATINAYFSGADVTPNVLAGGDASRYPAGNLFPTVAAFNGGVRDRHLSPSRGQSLQECRDGWWKTSART